jgi:arginase
MRQVAVVGAPSSIGLRPHHETGRPQDVNRAPETLRDLRVVERLDATDLGDVLPPPYEDFERPPGKARNEAGVASYSRSLADRVAAGLDDDRFPVVIGGDCTIVLGCLLGASLAGRDIGRAGRDTGSDRNRIGLAYVDGHADFAIAGESMTGSAASMGLALAVGRGESALARLAGPAPLVRGGDVALIGRRDQGQSYGHDALAVSGILDLPWATIAPDGATVRPTALADTASTVLDRVAATDVAGFWILIDADVLNPEVMPAVGSPEPGGPDIDELAALLAPLVAHPNALGMALTLYDPSLDPDLSAARRLVELLATSLHGGGRHAAPA